MGHAAKSKLRLFDAVKQGNHKLLKLLLKRRGHLINEADDLGRTLLYLAAENGHHKIVKLLLKEEVVDVNKSDIYHQSPFD